MIFDCDSHISPYKMLPESIGAEEWDARMERAGIDKAICWLMQQKIDTVYESNRYIYESSKRYARMVPFGWISLKEGIDNSLDETTRCLKEYGFRGIKINGSQNFHNIDSPETLRIVERIAELGGMVAFHIGAESPEYTNPKRAAVVARLYPEMPVIMVHMGGVIKPDVSEAVIEAAAENPNMMLVGSSISVDKVANAIRKLGPERVLFGSDTPYHEPATVILDRYNTMLKEFDGATAELVLGLNAKRMFSM